MTYDTSGPADPSRRNFLGRVAGLAAAAAGAPAFLTGCDGEATISVSSHGPVTVAAAGTRAEQRADFVVRGPDAHAVIEQAMDHAAATGRGKVLVMAGEYAHTSPILMLNSGVHLEFEPGAVLFPATPWVSRYSPYDPDFKLDAGISAVGIEDFSVVGATIDPRVYNVHANGVQAVPRVLAPGRTADNGTPCVRGRIAGCRIYGIPGHSYLIWSLRARDMVIEDNWVEHANTDFRDPFDGEGIEVYGGTNVSVARNTVRNCGAVGLNVVAVGNPAADASIDGVHFINNVVDFCRTMIGITCWWDPVGGPQHLRNLTFAHNVGRRIAKNGMRCDISYSGPLDRPAMDANPTHVDNLLFHANTVQWAPLDGPAAEQPLPEGHAFRLTSALGGALVAGSIQAIGNVFTGSTSTTAHGHVRVEGVPGFAWTDNHLLGAPVSGDAPGMYLAGVPGARVSGGSLGGARSHGVQVQVSDGVAFSGLNVVDWNLSGTGSYGILVENSSYTDVSYCGFRSSVLTNVTAIINRTSGTGHTGSENRYLGSEYTGPMEEE